MRPRKLRKKNLEFSKLVLALVISTYFFGVGIGAFVVYRSNSELGVYLTFIGAPVATALSWYYWKAKNENMQKHGQAAELPALPDVQTEFKEEQSI